MINDMQITAIGIATEQELKHLPSFGRRYKTKIR